MEIISFLNLSKKETNIELEFSMWVNKYFGKNTVLFDYKGKSIELRNFEKSIFLEDNFINEIPIIKINNFKHFEECIQQEKDRDLIVCQFSLEEDTVSFLGKFSKIFIIIDDIKTVLQYSKLLENIISIVGKKNTEYILLSESDSDYLYYNKSKEQKTSFHIKNVNQKLFSRLTTID